jgi:DNA-binding GntR family transcriptional regulator
VELAIDVTSPVHPYIQIADQLRDGVASGKYVDKVPSTTEIVKETGCAYNTARRALTLLVKEGLLDPIPGRGTFVKRDG